MKHCYLTLFFCFCAMGLYANPAFPPAIQISNDTMGFTVIDEAYWQKLNDSNGTWTIRDVSSTALYGSWHQNIKDKGGIGRVVHTYWLRYRLKNAMDRQVDLVVYPNYADAIDYYFQQSDGIWQHQKTGQLVPASG